MCPCLVTFHSLFEWDICQNQITLYRMSSVSSQITHTFPRYLQCLRMVRTRRTYRRIHSFFSVLKKKKNSYSLSYVQNLFNSTPLQKRSVSDHTKYLVSLIYFLKVFCLSMLLVGLSDGTNKVHHCDPVRGHRYNQY